VRRWATGDERGAANGGRVMLAGATRCSGSPGRAGAVWTGGREGIIAGGRPRDPMGAEKGGWNGFLFGMP
jgi:hypothetical protein